MDELASEREAPMTEAELAAWHEWIERENRCPFCELVVPCAHWDANGDEWTDVDRASWN